MNREAEHAPHVEEHFESTDFVKDVVIGMADGLTVPFALAAGLSGAVDSGHVILVAGIAEIAAGSVAMGLGGYLAGKTEADHYDSELKREYYEVEAFPQKEKQEVIEVLQDFGVSENSSREITEEMSKDKDKWVKFMMRFELGLEKPDPKRARNSAVTIGLSYIAGGLIPLSPYLFIGNVSTALMVSVAITLVALFVFGFLKSKATGQPPLMGPFAPCLLAPWQPVWLSALLKQSVKLNKSNSKILFSRL